MGYQEYEIEIAIKADEPSRVGDRTSIVTNHSLFDRVKVKLPRKRSDKKRLPLFGATHLILELPRRRQENGVITRVGIVAY